MAYDVQTTTRSQRMIDSAPDYYQYSRVFGHIQQGIADEFDQRQTSAEDLRKQLYIRTATWGLQYWEEALGLPVLLGDSYAIRRSCVLAKWRGLSGNFSARMVKSICESFQNGEEVEVTFDPEAGAITIDFVGRRGIPPNMSDLEAQIDNVVHAHLGVVYKINYLYWSELESGGLTFDQLDTYTWDTLEVTHL